jgi:hypothetical protein
MGKGFTLKSQKCAGTGSRQALHNTVSMVNATVDFMVVNCKSYRNLTSIIKKIQLIHKSTAATQHACLPCPPLPWPGALSPAHPPQAAGPMHSSLSLPTSAPSLSCKVHQIPQEAFPVAHHPY